MKRYAVLLLALVLGTIAQAAPPRIFKAVRSPEVSSDGRVTLRYFAPNAQKVSVEMEGSPSKPMTKDEKGVWSVVLGPLEPDFYPYTFQVDGVQVGDPANPLSQPIVTGGVTNLAHVPGPKTLPWEDSDVPHGVVHQRGYFSSSLGESRTYLVYTPPGYDARSRTTYPVLILLHGVMDDQTAWTTAGRANVILDNLISQGKAKPMIVVMPLGYGFANVPDQVGDIFFRPADWQRAKIDALKLILLEEVLPQLNKECRTKTGPDNLAIAGLSMGGAQALSIGLNQPNVFGWVGSFSGAMNMYGPKLNIWFASPTGKAPHLIYVSCGTEDFLIEPNRATRKWLTGQGFKLEERETAGSHTWMVWKRNFAEFLSTLFVRP